MQSHKRLRRIGRPWIRLACAWGWGRHFAYETNDKTTSFIARNFPDAVIRGDVRQRGSDDNSRCDITTAGFPCQPFSLLGLGLVRNEAGGRGCLVDHTVLEIRARKPAMRRQVGVANRATIPRASQSPDQKVYGS